MTRFPTPGERFGRYLIEERIGMGGMGVVFRARDTRLDRVVALKVVSGRLAGAEEFLRRFEREADIMARLDSPHVVTIHDHGVEGDLPWLSTQYVAGGDLGALLSRGPLHLHHAAIVCAQVAEALADAHRAGVVHRDVKPSNVLLRGATSEPFAYLCDFGIAHTGTTGLTQTGGVAGSWAWLAPERTSGDPGTPASDIYSLGCLFHATLTGHPPYAGSDVEVAIAQVQAPVPQFPGDDPTTRQVNAVLGRAMAKDPSDRYASADDLRAALLALVGAEPTVFPHASPATAPQLTSVRAPGPVDARGSRASRAGGWRPTTTLVALATATLLLGVAAVAYWLSTRDEKESPGPASATAVAGDVDGDGLGDVLVRWYGYGDSGQPSTDRVIRSTGTAFAAPQPLPTRVEGLPGVGDVDGDGRLDTVGLDEDSGSGEVTVQIAFADRPVASVVWPEQGFRGRAVPLLGDVDGDGLDDLVMVSPTKDPSVQSRSTGKVEVALSTSEGFGEPQQWGTIREWTMVLDGLSLGDFDGDARADLLLERTTVRSARTVSGQLFVMPSTGSAFDTGGQPLSLPTPDQGVLDVAVVVGDVDGDDVDEVVTWETRHEEDDRILVHEADGGRVRAGKVWLEVDASDLAVTIAAPDVDGDGDADLVLLGTEGDGADGKSTPLSVGISDGKEFAAMQEWLAIECLEVDCKESWVLLRRGQ